MTSKSVCSILSVYYARRPALHTVALGAAGDRPLSGRVGLATSSPLFSFGRPRLLPALVGGAFTIGLAIVDPAHSFAAPDSRIPMATFCSKGTAGGKYGLASKAEKHKAAENKEQQLVEATEWANEQLPGGSSSSRARMAENEKDGDNEKRWPLLTFSVIRYRLDNEGKDERRGCTLLTGEEEVQLVTWLNKCGDAGKPIKDLVSITAKVRAIIKGRRIWNSHMREETEIVPLSKVEEMQMLSWASDLSKTWETNFRARHAATLDKKHAKVAESRRASKQTEAVVGRHFFGEFGLRQELIDARIMNPITNIILDPRRLLNFDETPQMVDGAATGSKEKAFGIPGKALRDDQGINREVVEVGICWGLDGFCYGPQFNIALKDLQAGFAVKALPGYKSFNDTISVAERKSFYSHVVTSDKGVQTRSAARRAARSPSLAARAGHALLRVRLWWQRQRLAQPLPLRHPRRVMWPDLKYITRRLVEQ
ncbi:hypothetical protein T492DRAFT_1109936 [Pavlovales sp. CCMP2436]|nr:hypothetical protein T492DRAFT_1109936 [Pavlovales sp. CCMP2436]